jgi:hypothetical protein
VDKNYPIWTGAGLVQGEVVGPVCLQSHVERVLDHARITALAGLSSVAPERVGVERAYRAVRDIAALPVVDGGEPALRFDGQVIHLRPAQIALEV